MSLEATQNKLRDLIQNGKHKSAIEDLSTITQQTKHKHLANQVRLQSAAFNKYQADQISGVAPRETLSVQINQINKALLEIVDLMDQPASAVAKLEDTTDSSKNQTGQTNTIEVKGNNDITVQDISNSTVQIQTAEKTQTPQHGFWYWFSRVGAVLVLLIALAKISGWF